MKLAITGKFERMSHLPMLPRDSVRRSGGEAELTKTLEQVCGSTRSRCLEQRTGHARA